MEEDSQVEEGAIRYEELEGWWSSSDSSSSSGNSLVTETAPGAYRCRETEDGFGVARRIEPSPKGQELEPSAAREASPIRKSEPVTRKRRCSWRIFLTVSVAVWIIFVVLAVVIGVVLGKGASRSTPETDGPIIAFTLQEVVDLILIRSNSTSFGDSSSPQSRALDWLVEDSYSHAMVASSQHTIGDRLLHRFAVATLWYSATGEEWDNARNWVNPVHECDWENLVCDEATRTRIVQINLASNHLIGTIPRELSLLTNLEVLAMENNDLYGDIQGLTQLAELHVLDLNSNSLSGTIPSELLLLSELWHLDLGNNGFTGTIPTELFHMTQLEELNLVSNRLLDVWTLSSSIGGLANLRVLHLDTLGIRGTLPSTIGQLTRLSTLTLIQNELSGTLPTELGRLASMAHFDFSVNELKGPLPSELGLLTNLKILDGHVNQLAGPLFPLVNLTQLAELRLYKNCALLEGYIPSSLCAHVKPRIDSCQGQDDCATIGCDCCTYYPVSC